MYIIMQSTSTCWRLCGVHNSRRLAREHLIQLVYLALQELDGETVTRERTSPAGATEYEDVPLTPRVVRDQLVVELHEGLADLQLEVTLPHFVYSADLRWGEFSEEHGQWDTSTGFFVVRV
jgi:hypothetical protein